MLKIVLFSLLPFFLTAQGFEVGIMLGASGYSGDIAARISIAFGLVELVWRLEKYPEMMPTLKLKGYAPGI